MRSGVKDQQQRLSEKAHALLGHLVTLADSQGEVAVTRRMLAKALGVSVPTVSRALRELREAGEIAVVTEGGGRGLPTKYRITAVARDTVRVSRGSGGSCRRSPGATADARPRKQYPQEPFHEPDRDPETVESIALELGEALVAVTVGLLQGAWRAWRGAPVWGRMALAGVPLGTTGALIGRARGGWLGSLLGGGAGILIGALLATLTPSDSGVHPQQSPVPCPNQPTESTLNGVDPIPAIIGKPVSQGLGNQCSQRSRYSL